MCPVNSISVGMIICVQQRTDAHTSRRATGRWTGWKKHKQSSIKEREREQKKDTAANAHHKVRPVPDDRLVARARSRSVYRAHALAASHPLSLFSSFFPSFSGILTFSLPLPLSSYLHSSSCGFAVRQLFFFAPLIFLNVIITLRVILDSNHWLSFSDWKKTSGKSSRSTPTPSGGSASGLDSRPLVCTFLFILFFCVCVLFHSFSKRAIPIPRSYKEKEKREGGDSKNGGHNLPRLPARPRG